MTLRNFLTYLENYYGEKYSGVVLDTMTAYLADYSESFLQTAAGVLVKRFSRTFGKAPGPAEIEKHMDEILNTMPKPVRLTEPEQEISAEEREEVSRGLTALKENLASGKNPGPLAAIFSKTIDSIEEEAKP